MEEDLDLGRKLVLVRVGLERVVGCVKEKAELVDTTLRRRVAMNFIVAGFLFLLVVVIPLCFIQSLSLVNE